MRYRDILCINDIFQFPQFILIFAKIRCVRVSEVSLYTYITMYKYKSIVSKVCAAATYILTWWSYCFIITVHHFFTSLIKAIAPVRVHFTSKLLLELELL